MVRPALHPIVTLLINQREEIAKSWLGDLVKLWTRHYPGQVNEDELRRQLFCLLDELTHLLSHHSADSPPDIEPQSTLAELVREISAARAKAGFKPTDTAQLSLTLKNTLVRRLVSEMSHTPGELSLCVGLVDDVLDRLSMLSFEAFVETRERVIAQQSLSLQELSTPVIRLWNQLILLPLVGVVDTLRARQITERLLEAITRYEATVTIIDVTGVPVFDTSVARHIMKTVDAAQLLGSRVVMTGISPEGAQTLTKLGISFSGVISRASLRAGVAEAFAMLNLRVVRTPGGQT